MLNKESKLNYMDMNMEFQEADKLFERKEHQERGFNMGLVRFFFAIIFFTNLLINIDHGVIPACTTVLKSELGLTEVSLGTLGSFVYLGLALGSLAATPLFAILNQKWIIIVSLILNAVGLSIFPLSHNFWLLAFSRICVGFFQVFFPLFCVQICLSSCVVFRSLPVFTSQSG